LVSNHPSVTLLLFRTRDFLSPLCRLMPDSSGVPHNRTSFYFLLRRPSSFVPPFFSNRQLNPPPLSLLPIAPPPPPNHQQFVPLFSLLILPHDTAPIFPPPSGPKSPKTPPPEKTLTLFQQDVTLTIPPAHLPRIDLKNPQPTTKHPPSQHETLLNSSPCSLPSPVSSSKISPSTEFNNIVAPNTHLYRYFDAGSY